MFKLVVKKPLYGDGEDLSAVQGQINGALANTAHIEHYKRMRQIAVEAIWCISRIKMTGNIDGEMDRLEAWCKEMETLLISVGVNKEQLYSQGFSPNRAELWGGEASKAASEIDGSALMDQIHAKTTSLDVLHRPQLLAVSWHLGATEEETRGKPVKKLREMVITRMAVNDAPTVKPLTIVKKPSNGVSTFRLPRRLT